MCRGVWSLANGCGGAQFGVAAFSILSVADYSMGPHHLGQPTEIITVIVSPINTKTLAICTKR